MSGLGEGRGGRGTGGSVVVLLVLLGLLVGAVALERREPDVGAAHVVPAGLDGPVVPPQDAVSSAWYCAAGSSSPDGATDETVVVANLSPRNVAATVTVDAGDAAEARTRELDLDPYERARVRVADVLAVDSPGVVVEVTGGRAIVEHEIRGHRDVAMSPCAVQPSASWFFAAGSTVRGTTQTLELFNPFGDDAIVDIGFLTDGGVQEPQELQGFVVGRRSKVRVAVQDLVARQERTATIVRARTGRVVAEQVRTFDGTTGSTGLTLALGVNAPRREWTLPVAAGAASASGSVTIANTRLNPAHVEVSVLLAGEGVLTPQSVDVPSRSVMRVDTSRGVPAGTAYAVVVRSLGGTPVVAEASLELPVGAATATGASVPARRWAIAGAPTGTGSAVIAVNRSTAPVTIELRAYTVGDPDSPRSAPAIAVEPGKVARFDLDELDIDDDQVLVVSANGPIVAGREVYAGGVSLALGVPFDPGSGD